MVDYWSLGVNVMYVNSK